MKTICTFCLMLIFGNLQANDGNRSTLSKHQAEIAVDFLNQQDVIVFFDSCRKSKKEYIRLERISARRTGYLHFYELEVEGYLANGMVFKQVVDLSQVFVLVQGKTICAGKHLRFYCDPCVLSFDWVSPFNYSDCFDKLPMASVPQ